MSYNKQSKNSPPSSEFEHKDRCPSCGSPCNLFTDLDENDYCNDCRAVSNNKQTMGTVGILTNKIENPEWVFQFNDDEPMHFAGPLPDGGAREVTFTIGDTKNSNIVFHDGKGNTFKLFAREKQGENSEQQ